MTGLKLQILKNGHIQSEKCGSAKVQQSLKLPTNGGFAATEVEVSLFPPCVFSAVTLEKRET